VLAHLLGGRQTDQVLRLQMQWLPAMYLPVQRGYLLSGVMARSRQLQFGAATVAFAAGIAAIAASAPSAALITAGVAAAVLVAVLQQTIP
jgi:hypothetical protein